MEIKTIKDVQIYFTQFKEFEDNSRFEPRDDLKPSKRLVKVVEFYRTRKEE